MVRLHRRNPDDDEFYFTAFAVTMITCSLSIFGSITIVVAVLRAHLYRDSLMQRLMLGLSGVDLITSIATLVQTFLLPKYTGFPMAVGTDATCEAVAFCFMFLYASYLYSCGLSLYFLLTVKCGWSEKQTAKWLDPWVHVIPWTAAFLVGSIGIVSGSLNPNEALGGCMFNSYPAGCQWNPALECTRGGNSTSIMMVVYSAMVLLASCMGILCIVLVWKAVREQMRRSALSDVSELNRQRLHRTKAVAIQATLYSLVFLNSTFVTVVGIAVSILQTKIRRIPMLRNGTLILLYIFMPSQGFLNMIIYMRPTVTRWKNRYPDLSWMGACRLALNGGQSLPKGGDHHRSFRTARSPAQADDTSSTFETPNPQQLPVSEP